MTEFEECHRQGDVYFGKNRNTHLRKAVWVEDKNQSKRCTLCSLHMRALISDIITASQMSQ